LIDGHDPTVVVLAATTTRAASALQSLVGLLRVPPVVLVGDDPGAGGAARGGAWTAPPRRAGVRAVLAQDAGTEQISAAIAAATAGLITLHPDALRARVTPRSVGVETDRTLPARQREILEMLAGGLSNRAIGARLGISTYTVKFHVAAILEALGAGTR